MGADPICDELTDEILNNRPLLGILRGIKEPALREKVVEKAMSIFVHGAGVSKERESYLVVRTRYIFSWSWLVETKSC